MGNAILTHARFQRPPVVSKRHRCRLPRNVISISNVPRLRVGALAEIVASGFKENIGIRVRLLKEHLPNVWECESLDRDIERFDG